jgi:hypothetical protein
MVQLFAPGCERGYAQAACWALSRDVASAVPVDEIRQEQMDAGLRRAAAGMRAVVRRFLARGWRARVSACLVVSLAAVVWLGALGAVLRVLIVIALVVAIVCCVWLVAAVWRQPLFIEGAPLDSFSRLVWRHLSRVAYGASSRGESPSLDGLHGFETKVARWEDALAELRRSVDAMGADLLGRQERLNDEAERLQRELGAHIEAMCALVTRVARFEQNVSRMTAVAEPSTTRASQMPEVTRPSSTASAAHPQGAKKHEADASAETELEAVLRELEADLRLEKLEEREKMLAELEQSLNRRERELAALVSQTQALMG